MYFYFFCEFLEDVKFLENRNKIFEESSLKAFFRQSFRVFDFSNLSSDSRYFESVTLKNLPNNDKYMNAEKTTATLGLSRRPANMPLDELRGS